MDMTLEIGVFLAYACAFFTIVFLGKLFKAPLKLIGKLLLNSVVGLAAILLINIIGSPFDINIPLNIVNSLIIGLLGLPGIVMIFVINSL